MGSPLADRQRHGDRAKRTHGEIGSGIEMGIGIGMAGVWDAHGRLRLGWTQIQEVHGCGNCAVGNELRDYEVQVLTEQ